MLKILLKIHYFCEGLAYLVMRGLYACDILGISKGIELFDALSDISSLTDSFAAISYFALLYEHQ
jgi:hypothetical protein